MPRWAQELRRLTSRFIGLAMDQGLSVALTRLWRWVDGRSPCDNTASAPQNTFPTDTPRPAAAAPTLAVIVPVFNSPPKFLEACIESVRRQTYHRWELCICDDASTSRETLAVLNRYQGTDPRIRILRSTARLNIAAASNLAAEQASGGFIAFLDHDDCLHPEALAEIAKAAESHDNVDLIYTDEDKIEVDGAHSEPYCKPDWSPEHLRSVMYVLHCLCIRKRLFWALGGLRSEYDGAQDYDLALRASASARRIVHVPRILYHWRKSPGSAAAQVDAKPHALDAGRRALSDAIGAEAPQARVEPGLLPGTFRVRYEIIGTPPVTLLILTGLRRRQVDPRGEILLVDNCIRSILAKSSYSNYRLLVVHDGEFPLPLRKLVGSCEGRVASYRSAGDFNFARKANFALGFVETEYVVLLNDDLEVIAHDWIEALLEHIQRPEIGGVGGRLLFPDGSLQHAGIVCGLGGEAGHVFYGMPANAVGYGGFSHLIRNYSAVTAAAFATRMDIVRRVGPFDERLPVDFNDVDFCLRVWKAGFRVVYTPYCTLHHYEGSSIKRTHPMNAEIFRDKWKEAIERDPFYSPELSRTRFDCGFDYGLLPGRLSHRPISQAGR